MSRSNQQVGGDTDEVRVRQVQLGFYEFTSGAPHPLSSTYTVLLPPFPGFYVNVSIEVLGDHILVLLWCPQRGAVFYLVSWKTGSMTLVSSLSISYIIQTQAELQSFASYKTRGHCRGMGSWCLWSSTAN
jgi:hypothetical protein